MNYLNEESAPEPHGFINTGVICYWNSLMQCLLSCTSINDILKSEQYIKLQTSQDSHSFLQYVIQQLRAKNINYTFGNSQESASEALVLLTEVLPIDYLLHHRYRRYVECGNCGKLSDIKKEHTLHFEMFGAVAEAISNTTEFIQFLKRRQTHITDYICDHCDMTSAKSTRYEILEMLPEIIILVYNKYFNKSNSFFIPTEFAVGHLKYIQVGQIRHSGSLYGGHYWAIIRRNNKIYMANDLTIMQMPAEMETSPQIYMVFYHIIIA